MTTLNLTPSEAVAKAKELISEKRGFDFCSKNSQYIFDERDEEFYRVNLWSNNSSDYSTADKFVSQLKRSCKDIEMVTINIYLG